MPQNMPGETLPVSIPQEIKLPTFQETVGQVPPSEIKRLGADWQGAVNLVWEVNEPLLERDYTKDERIKADLKTKLLGKDPTDQEVENERQRRNREITTAQETDPDKISDTDSTVVTTANQLVKEDPSFKDRSPNDPDVLKEAKKREAKRREGLIKARDELYAAEDEVEAIKEAAEKAAEQAFEEAKKKKLQELTDEARKKDPNAAEVTAFPADEETKLKEEIRAKIVSDYYDQENGIYYRLGPDGKPDKANPASTPEAYGPVYDELKRLDDLGDAEAKKLLETLIYVPGEIPEKGAFRVFTEEEIRAKEIEKADELVLKAALGQFKDLLKPEEYIVDGKVDEQKLKEYLKKLEAEGPSEAVASLSQLLGIYLEAPEGETRENVLAIIYSHLSNINLDSLKDLSPDGKAIFADERIQGIETKFKEWLEQRGYKYPPDVPLNRILKYLVTAQVIQEKQLFERDASGHPSGLSKAIKEYLHDEKKWGEKFDPSHESILFVFASNEGYPSTFVSQTFGINVESLLNPDQRRHYTNRTVEELIKDMPENTPEQVQAKNGVQRAYQQVSHFHISDESLQKLAEKRGFPKKLGYGLLVLMIFAPSIQGLLSLDVKEGEGSGSSGPHG